MSTSGSFVNASPPCPAPMTRAALIALRNAGQLRTECHYIITDGPTIGTAGNTSVTRIELHATDGSHLSQDVRVQTTFNPDTAWDGNYDLDIGANGTLFMLRDNWNNEIHDDATVAGQFPWHLAGLALHDNLVGDSTLSGWDTFVTAGGMITDNILNGVTADLVGAGDASPATLVGNTISNSTVTSRSARTHIEHNDISSATVINLGNQVGGFGFRTNLMQAGSFEADAATTATLSIGNNVFLGSSGGYRVKINGATGTAIALNTNRFSTYNGNLAGQELLISGSGTVAIDGCQLSATDITLNSTGGSQLNGDIINFGTLTRTTSAGQFFLQDCNLPDTDFTLSGTGSGNTTVRGGYMNESTISVMQGSSGALTLAQVDTNGAVFTVSASGANTPTVQRGRVMGAILNTGGFSIDIFDVVGGVKTLTADQSDRVRNASTNNLI